MSEKERCMPGHRWQAIATYLPTGAERQIELTPEHFQHSVTRSYAPSRRDAERLLARWNWQGSSFAYRLDGTAK